MRKSRILFVVLAVAVTFTLFSCNPLAVSKTDTGTFAYTIPAEIIQNIRTERFTGTEDTWYLKFKVTIWSSDGTSYPEQTKTVLLTYEEGDDWLETDRQDTQITFTSVPLNTPMFLSMSIYIDAGEGPTPIKYTIKPRQFSISDGNNVNVISVSLDTPYETPFLMYHAPVYSGDAAKLYYFNSADTANNIYYADYLPATLLQPNAACYDMAERLWFLDDDGVLNYNDGEETKSPSDIPETAKPQTVLYDPITDKLVVVAYKAVSGHSGWYAQKLDLSYDEEAAAINALSLDFIDDVGIEIEQNPFDMDNSKYYDSSADTPLPTPIAYAYDDYLYALRCFSRTSSTSTIECVKITLSDIDGYSAGDIVSTGTVSIPDCNPGSLNIAKEYSFNDIAVMDDSVYILWHQLEVWNNSGSNQFSLDDDNDHALAEGWTAENIGYVDRGGIQVLQANNLSSSGYIGVQGLQNTFEYDVLIPQDGLLPLQPTNPESEKAAGYWREPIFEDPGLTTPYKVSFPITWAIAIGGGDKLSNPQKIVAIKPKKLIIADGGSFVYTDSDSLHTDPVTGDTCFAVKDQNLSQIDYETITGIQLVSVNLENFAVNNLCMVDTDYSCFKAADPVQGIKFEYSQHSGSYYSPAQTYTGYKEVSCGWNTYNYTIHFDFDNSVASQFNGSSYIENTVKIGQTNMS